MSAKKRLAAAVLTVACLAFASSGCSSGDSAAAGEAAEVGSEAAVSSPYPGEGRYLDNITALNDVYEHAEKDAANAEANQPSTYTDRNGFTVQPVPNDPVGYNITYLNAEKRGCTSCHALEDAVMSMPTFHRVIFQGYNTETTFHNCVVCHGLMGTGGSHSLSIHGLHLGNDKFTENMNGSCDSCHYVTNGEFEMWDFEKYNVYRGYTLVDSATAALNPTYDTETVTPAENRYYKSVGTEPSEWPVDDSLVSQDVLDNWTLEFSGDIENPCTMTMKELIEKFGLSEQLMKNHCIIDGPNNATIYQSLVSGIFVEDLIEFLQPKEGANVYRAIGDDGYAYGLPLDLVIENKSMLVTHLDGELMPFSDGGPVASWVGGTAAGDQTKRIVGISIETATEAEMFYMDPATGIYGEDIAYVTNNRPAFLPVTAVLNYPNGVVLEDQVGKAIHFEGYADAFDRPVTKLEYSLDKGATWTELPVVDHDPIRWVYWRMDFTPEAAGSYLLTIRATCEYDDGEQLVNQYDTQFLFNVR